MERYITQLIEDLRDAHQRAPRLKPREEMTEEDILHELQEIDRIIHEDPPSPFENIFGLDPDIFPPVEMLTKEQANAIAEEILLLWAAFNIEAVYPAGFPLERLYPLLIDKFRESFLYFPGGITGLELCNYDPDNCPFGPEFCTCREVIETWHEYEIQVRE
jgi:hypothetical protein